MGYLDNSEIIVDAILTKKGRLKLAGGQDLGITKFALGDDEIDYTLYEPAHPKGSAYYDSAIRAIPVTEATPDETQILRYKILSLTKNSTSIPVVSLGMAAISKYQYDGPITITPGTVPTGNINSGYTAILSDSRAGILVASANNAMVGTAPVFLGEEIGTTATVVSGTAFSFTPNEQLRINIATTLTIYGNDTGGSISIPVTVTYKAKV
jgi:hypothetical protein